MPLISPLMPVPQHAGSLCYNNNNKTQYDIYNAVIMTTRSLQEYTTFDECRTAPSGRRPSDQAT